MLLTLFKEALDRKDRAAVNVAVRALIAADAPLGSQWSTIATVMAHNLEWPEAIEAAKRSADYRNDTQGRLGLASMLQRAGRISEARVIAEELPDGAGGPGLRAYVIGTLDTLSGSMESARSNLSDAVTLAPDRGDFWLALAMACDGRLQPAVAERADAAAKHASDMRDRGAFHYAHGRLLADRGEVTRAFHAFEIGAAMIGRDRPYEQAGVERRTEAVIRGGDGLLIEAIAKGISIPTDRPIIVTGAPRSGTTLVEQILTSHSDVTNGAELGLMRVVAGDVGGNTVHAIREYVATKAAADVPAALYLHLLDTRFGQGGRVVDKTLSAGWTMGLLAALLPGAPLVWMRRRPLDCAWSCFRTYFRTGNPWSWSLTDIAHHLVQEDRLLAHWRRTLGSRLLVIDYETLVTDPSTVIRSLLAHCGLTLEPQVFRPHETRRAVTTASVTQVRTPINARAIGTAVPYRRYLQPFIDEYRELGGTVD